jgi:hypothetical protein
MRVSMTKLYSSSLWWRGERGRARVAASGGQRGKAITGFGACHHEAHADASEKACVPVGGFDDVAVVLPGRSSRWGHCIVWM